MFTLRIPDAPVDRIAALDGFLAARRIMRLHLARFLGISQAAVTNLLNREVCSPGQTPHVLKLAAVGIPRKLLPAPQDGWPEAPVGEVISPDNLIEFTPQDHPAGAIS